MEQNNASVEVEHNGETVEVPTEFDRTDLASWFGDVPESFAIDRVYVYEQDALRAETYLGDEKWVCLTRQTEENRPIFNASEVGWVAEVVHEPEDAEEPGETVWER